jgi:hypothetical protein
MKTAQLQQQAKQLREQARVQEHLAANAMRAEVNRASNASMVNAVGGGHRIDAYTVEYQNSSVSSPSLRLQEIRGHALTSMCRPTSRRPTK